MKKATTDAIGAILDELLGELQMHPIPQEGHWVHRRTASGWQGSFVSRHGSYSLLFSSHQALIDRLSKALSSALEADYPEQMEWTGTATSGGPLQPQMVLSQLIYAALDRYGTFAISAPQRAELLAETAAFFDSPNVPPIAFPGDIVMRPITDEELTLIYGGNLIFQPHGLLTSFPDFVFVREVEVPKIIGRDSDRGNDLIWAPSQELLDRCLLALTAFKDGGPVGYDGVRITTPALAFGIAFGGQRMWGNDHVPAGNYPLESREAADLEAYASKFRDIHPSLEMACQRLIDASRRLKPRDSIADAVIGLEGLLLIEVGEKQRGENRFRFSLNYAAQFLASERKDAFRKARDLYDLRSLIAHGSQPKLNEKINGKEMSLHEISNLARSMLRQTLTRFMSNPANPDFLSKDYWMGKALGDSS